ncbi:hypothetical protein F5Y07DRAFT_182688 [Xylaria sp. FL0933]|nr:hypothetical protein F5Y07DRAFT_182688 [Xylaria sp. FL0933]
MPCWAGVTCHVVYLINMNYDFYYYIGPESMNTKPVSLLFFSLLSLFSHFVFCLASPRHRSPATLDLVELGYHKQANRVRRQPLFAIIIYP